MHPLERRFEVDCDRPNAHARSRRERERRLDAVDEGQAGRVVRPIPELVRQKGPDPNWETCRGKPRERLGHGPGLAIWRERDDRL